MSCKSCVDGCQGPVIMIAIIALFGGTAIMTLGYATNLEYNNRFWETKCNFTGYQFTPFRYNSWDCMNCTGYYASVITDTIDQHDWYMFNVVVYPPGNSVAKQTARYQQRWPIGAIVPCYETTCCSSAPIFRLADVVVTFWIGIILLSIGGVIAFAIIIFLIFKDYHRRRYTILYNDDDVSTNRSDLI